MGTDKVVFEEDRGKSDHCASLTGSDRKRPCPEDTLLFSRTIFPYFFSRTVSPVLFSPVQFSLTFFLPYLFPGIFSRPFCSRIFYFRSYFLSSSIKCWLGVFSTTSASYNHRILHPFLYFHILGVLCDVRVL